MIALEVVPDADEAARRAGELIARRAHGRHFRFALSRAPIVMLQALAAGIESWEDVELYQVDERVGAPAGSYERNASALIRLPTAASGAIRLMPMGEGSDPQEDARIYERELPAVLDLVHLGLGADGHTASLIPGDPVLEVRDRRVAVTGEYEGFQRMTLTYPALEAAKEIVWLVTGETKRDALRRLLARDTSIPAALITNSRQVLFADEAAIGGPPGSA